MRMGIAALALVALSTAEAVGWAQDASLIEQAGDRVSHGLELYAAGDLEGARREFAAAQAMLPEKPNPYRLLAMVDARLNRCADAIREADMFLKLAPPDDRRRVETQATRDGCERELAPKTATLTVRSIPDGAEVRLDDEAATPVGVTPLVLGSVAVGRHLVFLRKPGFEAVSRAVECAPGAALQLEVTMRAAQAAPASEEAVRRATAAVAAESERRQIEQLQALRAERRAEGRARWRRNRRDLLIAGGIFTGLGLATGAVALSYVKAGSDGNDRIRHGGLTLQEIDAIGNKTGFNNVMALSLGPTAGGLLLIGLPILGTGLGKLRLPAELRDETAAR